MSNTKKNDKVSVNKTSEIDAVKNDVLTKNINYDFLRKNQTRTLTRDEVSDKMKELTALTHVTFTFSNKYYYCVNAVFENMTVCQIWFKRDILRIVINKRSLEKHQNKFSVKLADRTAFKRESRNSDNLIECENEFILTFEEVKAFLKLLNDSVSDNTESK